MNEIRGDFETHVTVRPAEAEALAAFAAEHDVKFLEIELDRGESAAQPMLTLHGSGTLLEQLAMVEEWGRRLRAAGIEPVRGKVEATPWAENVPVYDVETRDEPADRYFEHHVKVRLPGGVADLAAITELVEPHGARLSRNPRKRSADGSEVRFVNQRCHRVGRETASERLEQLLAALREAGHEVVSAEQEYVVHDDNLGLDTGWLTAAGGTSELHPKYRQDRIAPAFARGYPATYHPVPQRDGVLQRLVFDPALKQHSNAFRAGEPIFDDPDLGARWRDARQAAQRHVLTVLTEATRGHHLVLRGSAAMAAWVGAAARDPGDLDFVVTPASLTSGSPEAETLLKGIIAELARRPGAGLRPERVERSAIWTYERADGIRLVIPFRVGGIPDGSVQVDLVFGEELPLPPEPVAVPGVRKPVRAAGAGLSLAWKLLWLATDWYPQGKDLYDAVLLAEHTTVELELVRELMRPELGGEADEFTAATVLGWADVEWDNFLLEYPDLTPGRLPLPWLRRLAVALDRAWSRD